MPNRLIKESSPYLLQHAENPVDWYPWGKEALEKARREDKPIFLSIGYAACHWCHVMAHESFENPQTAAFMNEHFVNIKVDREERPDLDSIYMNAVVAMTGQGGWPMSVFLTPEGWPFYGGTYFPPERRYNMPAFREVLETIARLWKEDRQRLLKSGEEIVAQLQARPDLSVGEAVEAKSTEEAALRLAQSYDWEFGGWGSAPKFPQPMSIEFLLRRTARGDSLSRDIAMHALFAMAQGGMYDLVGGGFARYSTDNNWLVPHFEKMLYDNAQLARVYLHAYCITNNPSFRQVCEGTLDFLVREMMEHPTPDAPPQGGFFSSLDADSEGVEGKYYIWTPAEIREALGDEEDFRFLRTAYGVTEAGNFEGKNVLQRAMTDEELAQRFSLQVEDVQPKLNRLNARLLEARQKRIRPGTDDKVLVSWNALALVAFAEAARYLKRNDYLEVARQNADFLLTELQPKDRLLRSWRNGQASHNAYLEDYAGLILGLLALYQTDPDPWWYSSALQFAEEMLDHYQDPQGGFFDTRNDQELLLIRPKDVQDNATPSGNSLATMALLQLSTFEGEGKWRDLAERALSAIQAAAVRYPTAFGNWLCAADFAIGPVHEIAILGDPEDERTQSLISALWQSLRFNSVAAISSVPPPPNSPTLLKDRPLLDEKPTAYVCQQFVCKTPVTEPKDLLELLDSHRQPGS